MQQQLLVFKSISMVVLEEVSTCIMSDEVVIVEIRVYFDVKNQMQHIRKAAKLTGIKWLFFMNYVR